MRKRLWASIAAFSTSASSALIGGAQAQTAALSPAPVTWTGCYAGAHAGLASGSSNWSATDDFWEVPSATMSQSGATGGGQAGCNYQIQSFVLGAEGEVWGSGLRGEDTATVVADFEGMPRVTTHSDTRSNFGSDLALRAGYAVDRLLLFGKIGVAWADYRFSDSSDFEGFSDTGADREAGLLLGFGAEFAIDAHWSIKGEFDSLHSGRENVAMSGAIPYPNAIQNTQDIFKLGANYRY